MYDLIIVGGGPSGSAAGRIAGKMGINTLLIEKEEHPRYKPCGGALSDHAISYLDFELPEDICEWDINGARVFYKGRVIEASKDYRVSTVVTRSKLDKFLLDRAGETGIEIHFREKVTDIQEFNDRVEVHTGAAVYSSKYLIIAEGSQGMLSRKVRRKDKKSEYGMCVVTEVPQDNGLIDRRLSNLIELHFDAAEKGYGWVFPHNGYYSVGLGGFAHRISRPKQALSAFLKRNGFDGSLKSKGHVIPSGGVQRKLNSSRILLAGDAAGFVDAFSGEGLAYAIRSGQLAAEVVVRSLQGLEDLNEYAKRCEKEFGEHLRYSLLFARIMHIFPDLTFKIFTNKPDILEKFIEVAAFKMTYKDFLKWIVFHFRLRWLF